ncbi:MAG TPA: L-fucose:H+ symporter permease [Bacteroidales bacterium]|nr:L-fucose:H+ symporter permease [Bacteroidales bacterium]HPJ60156.1 L-fucose:H+ symporter permease [Bacteroidales bacterium]HPR13342.1 L-fucose:H+ symporter permease [Bacteroidales bacterium]
MNPASIKERLIAPGNLIPFILITSLFFLWGLANNMTDTLLAAFKRIMSMTDARTSLIQISCYGLGYFIFALPAAIYIKRYSYKSGVLLGLGFYIIGCLLFFPAKLTGNYFHFLGALWILFGGLSILETAANPYIIAMGNEKTGTRRLNLAQSFNPLGSITGVIISQLFILSELNTASASERAAMTPAQLQAIQHVELNAVTITYITVGFLLLILWLIILITKMPRASDAGSAVNLKATLGRLFKNRNYVLGVIAQFFYVGAQIGVWSFTIRYAMNALNLENTQLPGGKTPEQAAATYYIAALILFASSRFIFTFLMKFFKPSSLLVFASVMAIVCSSVVIFGSGMTGVIALVAISGFMSLMFPTIFGQAVYGLGDDTKIGGSGLIMAILGGAVITFFQGKVSDMTGSINYSYVIPLLCFAFITYYAFASSKIVRKNAE